jgi:hypothetical protein
MLFSSILEAAGPGASLQLAARSGESHSTRPRSFPLLGKAPSLIMTLASTVQTHQWICVTGKRRKQPSEQTIFTKIPSSTDFSSGWIRPRASEQPRCWTRSIFSSPLNTSRSSVLTSASRKLRGTCCIGLKAATVRTTVPSSSWKSLTGSAFDGLPIMSKRHARLGAH